ncbi:MAG: hypothetical protein JXR58_10845 [Bacteroidales bacterium]|nr:hypothetical protein [Bacteroidales bacterium]
MKKIIIIFSFLITGFFLNAQEVTTKYNLSIDGKNGSEISLSTAKIIEKGEILVDPTTAQILAFNLEYLDNGETKVLSTRSRTITKEMKEVISSMTPGDSFKITGIILGEVKAVYSAPDIKVNIVE